MNSEPIEGLKELFDPANCDSEEIAKAGVPPLESLNLAALAKVRATPQEFTISQLVPSGEVTLLTGAGSAGKSLLAQQFATAAAAGKSILGFDVEPGPAIYITCEDRAEQLHWRQEHLCQALGVDMASLHDKLHLISRRGHLDNPLMVATERGAAEPSTFYRQIESKIRETGARHVWLDHVAHMFTGNENDRGEVTQFVNLLNRLAGATGAAIVLLAHPNKAGDDYSGSTGWSNAVRSRILLAHDEETDVRTISNPKSNYARKGQQTRFVWANWAFMREDDLPPNVAAELAATAKATAANNCFLDCLRKAIEQRENVSHASSASNYAPKRFAAMSIGKRFSLKDHRDAMNRLLDLGAIRANEKVFQYDNRTWAKGLIIANESAQRLAQSPHNTPREGCTKPFGE